MFGFLAPAVLQGPRCTAPKSFAERQRAACLAPRRPPFCRRVVCSENVVCFFAGACVVWRRGPCFFAGGRLPRADVVCKKTKTISLGGMAKAVLQEGRCHKSEGSAFFQAYRKDYELVPAIWNAKFLQSRGVLQKITGLGGRKRGPRFFCRPDFSSAGATRRRSAWAAVCLGRRSPRRRLTRTRKVRLPARRLGPSAARAESPANRRVRDRPAGGYLVPSAAAC